MDSKFHTTLKELVSEIQALYNDSDTPIITPKCAEKIEANDPELLEAYYKNASEVGIELSTKNEIVFSEDVVLLDGISFYALWNSDISDETKESLWKYLHTMYLYADHHLRKSTLGSLIKKYKEASVEENMEVDHQTEILFGILTNLCGEKLSVKTTEGVDVTEGSEGAGGAEVAEGAGGSGGSGGAGGSGCAGGASNNSGFALGGSIGKLAGEIAQDIDPNDFQIDDPNQMLQSLLSGKLDQNSPMLKIVNKINTTIQSKLSNGELNEMDLFKEAQGVMQNMGVGRGGGGANGDSPFNMFEQMSNCFEGAAQGGGGTTRPTQAKAKILKDKLKRKKKLLKSKRPKSE